MANRKNLIAIMLGITLLFGIAFAEGSFFIEDENAFNMSAQVIEVSGPNTKIGFDADTYELNFGRVPVGGRSRKFIDLSNPLGDTAKIKVLMDGNITKYVDLNADEVFLGPKQSMQIEVTFNSIETGNYTGELRILSYIPRNKIAGMMLKYI